MNMENINPGGFTVISPESGIWKQMLDQFLDSKEGEIDEHFEVKLMSITAVGGRICLLIKWADHTGHSYIIFQESLRFPAEFTSKIKELQKEEKKEEEECERNPLSI